MVGGAGRTRLNIWLPKNHPCTAHRTPRALDAWRGSHKDYELFRGTLSWRRGAWHGRWGVLTTARTIAMTPIAIHKSGFVTENQSTIFCRVLDLGLGSSSLVAISTAWPARRPGRVSDVFSLHQPYKGCESVPCPSNPTPEDQVTPGFDPRSGHESRFRGFKSRMYFQHFQAQMIVLEPNEARIESSQILDVV